MSLIGVLGPACLLVSVETEVVRSDGMWVEEHQAEIRASKGACRFIDIDVPAGAHVSDTWARVHFGDSTRRPLEAERWEALPDALDGSHRVRLHTPELLPGDSVRIRFTRSWTSDEAYRWLPQGAALAELRWQRGMPFSAFGDAQPDGPRGAWAADSVGGSEVRLHLEPIRPTPVVPTPDVARSDHTLPEALALLSALETLPQGADGPVPVTGAAALAQGAITPAGYAHTLAALTADGPTPVDVGWWLPERMGKAHVDVVEGPIALTWDGSTPIAHALPGAPARRGAVWTERRGTVKVRTEPTPASPTLLEAHATRTLTLSLPDGDPQTSLWPGGGSQATTAWTFTAPASASSALALIPLPDGAESSDVAPSEGQVIARDRSLLWVLPPSDAPRTLTLTTTKPDAPACGLRREGNVETTSVLAEGGEVVQTETGWHLASWQERPVLPDRERLIAGLDYRFSSLSMPEPGLPLELKNHTQGWELVSKLRPILRERAVHGELPRDSAWPRRLFRARKSRIVTSIEAMLILRAYSLQARIPAAWVMARPAEDGPAHPMCPSTYTEGLVRVWIGEEERWLDPGCTVCTPWEIRPHLEGADALGHDIAETPPPTPGILHVGVGEDEVVVHAEGSSGLLLRTLLAPVPERQRAAALASILGGESSELTEAQGLTEPGARLVLRATVGSGPLDPLVPRPHGEGGAWFETIGVRALTRPRLGTPDVWIDRPAFRYVRESTEEYTREVLEVRSRALTAEDAAVLMWVRTPWARELRPVVQDQPFIHFEF